MNPAIIHVTALGIGAGLGSSVLACDNPRAFGVAFAAVFADTGTSFKWRNQAMLSAIRDIENRRIDRKLSEADQTDDSLRAARSGAMYGLTSDR